MDCADADFFDLYLIQRWTFVFSDVSLTQCSFCESYSPNWSQDFWALARSEGSEGTMSCALDARGQHKVTCSVQMDECNTLFLA